MATVINGSDASDADDDDAPCCFICLGGTDESGEPLTRECSCRGTMGYVHHSCLVNYLEEKKKQGYLFLMRCVICKQPYKNTNELASIVGRIHQICSSVLHSILPVQLKLSLMCLIGYSMALQSVKIWEECLPLFPREEMSHLLSGLRLFYQCGVIYAYWEVIRYLIHLEHITDLVLGCVIVISTLHFMSWVGLTCLSLIPGLGFAGQTVSFLCLGVGMWLIALLE